MMTFTEVKGHQTSNVVFMSYGYHIWSDVQLIQAKDDDDLREG